MKKTKEKEISKETKAVLTILIREIQDISNKDWEPHLRLEQIKELLNTWITANDLHPEQVVTLTKNQFGRRLKGIKD